MKAWWYAPCVAGSRGAAAYGLRSLPWGTASVGGVARAGSFPGSPKGKRRPGGIGRGGGGGGDGLSLSVMYST